MAIMHPIDATIHGGLTRLDDSYVAMQNIEIRRLEQVTAAEQALDLSWTLALDPVLADLYWWPLRNGLEQVPEDEAELRQYIEEKYHDDDLAVIALLLLLIRYQRQAVNIGGHEGLKMLGFVGADADFFLSNPALLDRLEEQAKSLATVNGEMSLIRTTIDHLISDIPAARASTGSTLITLGSMIAAHVITRSGLIAATENARSFAAGLNWVFDRNGVAEQEFVTRIGACRLCAPLHGRRMPVNNIPPELLIPIHANCRCSYSPVTDGWEQPETIWRGE